MPPKQSEYHSMVRKMIRESDVIVEVIDARFPNLTRARNYEKMVLTKKKSLIIAMNKIDLIPDKVAKEWKKRFQKEKIPVIATSARKRLSTAVLRKTILRYAPKKFFYVTACFIGLPNTGKSSLINILKGRASAGVAPIPGYTKALQVLRITTRLRIFDTPGVVPPSLSPTEQVLIGILRPEQLDDTVKAAWALVNRVDKLKPGTLKNVYDIEYDTPEEFLERFAEKRNKKKKGGELDLETAATIFINEHIQGKIPVWETPEKEDKN